MTHKAKITFCKNPISLAIAAAILTISSGQAFAQSTNNENNVTNNAVSNSGIITGATGIGFNSTFSYTANAVAVSLA